MSFSNRNDDRGELHPEIHKPAWKAIAVYGVAAGVATSAMVITVLSII